MKIVNLVLGLGTAIILGALIGLGIATFYPAPQSPTYPPSPIQTPCAVGDTKCITQQNNQQNAAQDQFNQQEDAYVAQMQVYNKNLFIIANIIGLIVFVIGFFIVLYANLASQGVPIGIMVAGLWSIVYGYARGWGSVDDPIKFVVGLVIAVVVIGGSMWLMQKRERKLSR